NGCTQGDERTLRDVGTRFTYWWAQNDAENLAKLLAGSADIRHPDGSIERGRDVIMANRLKLFTRPEYRGSKHPVNVNAVRCLGPDVAIGDGKWELRLTDVPLPSVPGRGGLAATATNTGLCTIVFVRAMGTWRIEAWRYTIDPPKGAPAPTLLSKPGYVGRGGGH